ncbi:MAG TPA: NAD-dependent epimerase/dehydratase family protein [Streptosporangiaceae bacterium]|nr:NAD-dependent epimerase/dehydratase family protein [Streptosporangiaceae bacterium]
MSTILITGGNGFVGRHLVTALLGRGDRVRVLALPAEDAQWLSQRGVEVYRGDIRDSGSLTEPVRGADAVLHLAAMMDVWRPIRDYRAVNVTGTENIARAALAAGVRRFVHMSSSSVYGMGHGRPVDESFPLAPFPDPYPVTKAEGDLAVQRMIATDQLPAVIIRPDQIFGPGDHLHFGAMADRLRAGRGILVGSGGNFMPFVYVDDVVRGLLLGLDHDEAPGHAYNITNDRPLTQRQMLTAIAEQVGGSPPGRRVPYRALYAAGYLAERLAALAPSGTRPPVTRLGVAFFGTGNRYAIGRARSELGYRPVVDLRDGVALTAAWYLRHARSGTAAPAQASPAATAASAAPISSEAAEGVAS